MAEANVQRVERVSKGDRKKVQKDLTQICVKYIKDNKLVIRFNHKSKSIFCQMKEFIERIESSLQGTLDEDQAILFEGFRNLGDDRGLYDYHDMILRLLQLYVPNNVVGDEGTPIEHIKDGEYGSPSGSEGEAKEETNVAEVEATIRKISRNLRIKLFGEDFSGSVLMPSTPSQSKDETTTGTKVVNNITDEESADIAVRNILEDDGFIDDSQRKLTPDLRDLCLRARKEVRKLRESLLNARRVPESSVSLPVKKEEEESDEDDLDEDLKFEPQKDGNLDEHWDEESTSTECKHCMFATPYKHWLTQLIKCKGLDDTKLQEEAFHNLQRIMQNLCVHVDDAEKGTNLVSKPIAKCSMVTAMISANFFGIPFMNHTDYLSIGEKDLFKIKHGKNVKRLFKKNKSEKIGTETVDVDILTKIGMKFTKTVLGFFSEVIKKLLSADDYKQFAVHLDASGTNLYTTIRNLNKKKSALKTLERNALPKLEEYIVYDKDPKAYLASCPFTKNEKVLDLVELIEHFDETYKSAAERMLLDRYGCNFEEAMWSHVLYMRTMLGHESIRIINIDEPPETLMTQRIFEQRKVENHFINFITDPRPHDDLLELRKIMSIDLFKYADRRLVINKLEVLLNQKPDVLENTYNQKEPLVDREIFNPLSVTTESLVVKLGPVINFSRVASSKAVKSISETETDVDRIKFRNTILRKDYMPSIKPRVNPPRLPLNINSATASKNNDVGVLMKAMKATVVTEQSQKLLNIKIDGFANPINMFALIRRGIQTGKSKALKKHFANLNESQRNTFLCKLQENTLNKMKEIKDSNQINYTRADGETKSNDKKKIKYVNAKMATSNKFNMNEKKWSEYVNKMQCSKCQYYGHLAPDCPGE